MAPLGLSSGKFLTDDAERYLYHANVELHDQCLLEIDIYHPLCFEKSQ